MDDQDLLERVRASLDELIEDFLNFPHAHRTERSMHCHLYHLMAKRGLDRVLKSGGGFSVRGLQNEYPPVIASPGSRHGLFDLVALDASGAAAMTEWNYRAADGRYVPPAIAIELKLGGGLRWNTSGVRLADLEKELSRLADKENGIAHPFLLYFYRVARYQDDDAQVRAFNRLSEIYTEGAGRFPRVTSWLISVEFDPSRGYRRFSASVTRSEDGMVTRTTKVFNDLIGSGPTFPVG